MSATVDWPAVLYSEYLNSVLNYFYQNYVDIHYVRWLIYIFYPLVITFLLPAAILIFLYASALFLQLYKLRRHFTSVYNMEFWDGARQIVAALWDAQGKIWHGYEIQGYEKIPATGPALLVYYHGALPTDMYYFMARTILNKSRQIRAVGDRFLFHIPGFKLLLDVFCVAPSTVSSSVDLLQQGHLLAVAPGFRQPYNRSLVTLFKGGVREALFSDEYYGIIWGKRIGFAKVAVEAKVPVIPVFTKNCRETFRSLSFGRSWLRQLYERTRLPFVPIYGGFPVKMTTFVGDPIEYDPALTAEQLAVKVHQSLDTLIRQHQKLPGNILRGLLERFVCS